MHSTSALSLRTTSFGSDIFVGHDVSSSSGAAGGAIFVRPAVSTSCAAFSAFSASVRTSMASHRALATPHA
eukprot:6244404-Prymnesium_polylepis.2